MTADRSRDRETILSELDRAIDEWYASAGADVDTAVRLSSLAFDAREIRAALRTMLGGWISQGPVVREFESEFASYVGVKHGIAVNSGSSANLVALSALVTAGKLQPGDEVIVPATTFPTVASPVIQIGCVPVYVDVDLETYNLDPKAVQRAIGPRTRAIMAVHTLGYPAEVEQLRALADSRSLVLFEDCCEAHGSAIRGRRVGSFGQIATCSFFVAHNMTTGEGGMIMTDDADLATICRSLREFGRVDQRDVATARYVQDPELGEYDRRYVFERLGYNVRMTDIAASFGREQLRKLEQLNARRVSVARRYTEHLARYPELRLPKVVAGYDHTYYTYPVAVRVDASFGRAEIVRELESAGIETRPIFAGCLPDQPAFRGVPGRSAEPLRNSREIRDRAFFIGVHPGLTDSHVQRVLETFDGFFAKRRAGAVA